MNSSKIKFVYELISALTIIPVMVMAIIKSFLLIPIDISKISLPLITDHQILTIIIATLQQINMLFAVMSIVILIINLGLIKRAERNPNIETIENWASWTIKLCALSNIFVTWFLDKSSAIQTDLKLALILWTITLALSVLSSLISKIMKK